MRIIPADAYRVPVLAYGWQVIAASVGLRGETRRVVFFCIVSCIFSPWKPMTQFVVSWAFRLRPFKGAAAPACCIHTGRDCQSPDRRPHGSVSPGLNFWSRIESLYLLRPR